MGGLQAAGTTGKSGRRALQRRNGERAPENSLKYARYIYIDRQIRTGFPENRRSGI